MDYQPAELASRLQAEGEAVQAFYKELTPEQWEVEVYSDQSRWRARDLLAHFIAAEQGFQKIIQTVAAGGELIDADFNIDAYNERTVSELRKLDNLVMLGQYAMVRERTVALVRDLTIDQLSMKGRHPWLGVAPIVEMVRLVYHHNNIHLRDVRRALKSSGLGRTAHSGAIG